MKFEKQMLTTITTIGTITESIISLILIRESKHL